MKKIGIFLILIFTLVREIYSISICLPEKYSKYEEVFKNVYRSIVGPSAYQLEYKRYQKMDDYIKSLILYKCDIAMVEPLYYDEHYTTLADIYEQIKDTITERTKDDPVDGGIYKDLMDDLRADDERDKGKTKIVVTPRALPLFMDYGIFYYRNEKLQEPPKTWEELIDTYDNNEYKQYKNKIDTSTYIGQFNDYNEFFYNFIENVLNTNDKINYDVIEREANHTISLFKELFDKEIIDEFAWHLNSDFGAKRFNEGDALFMRNWSSNLYNITGELFNKTYSFGYTKNLYSEKRAESSKAVNKGIYLCVATSDDEDKERDKERISQAVQVITTLTSKEFMKKLVEEEQEFFDIPAYHSLIEEDGSINNSMYCNRINCAFFRDLQVDHTVAPFNTFFYQKFKDKFSHFYETSKSYFKDAGTNENRNSEREEVTLKSLMSLFSDLFKDKYVEYGSTTTIIMLIIVGIEIIITSIVTFYIIKYRNFIEIRRSSPLFLITMLFGIILAFVSIVTFIGKPTNFICILRPYILVLTFGLTFFSLLLKTFRIKVIFDKVNIQVKDSNLILYLCVLLGIELILVTVWSFVAGMKPDVKKVNDEMHYWVCKNTSNVGSTIQLFLIIINGLALVYGCYLAYKVKNVYSEYNESKVIGLSIYGIVICMIILMFIVNINSLDHTTLFLIQSLMIILSADIILVFMFTL